MPGLVSTRYAALLPCTGPCLAPACVCGSISRELEVRLEPYAFTPPPAAVPALPPPIFDCCKHPANEVRSNTSTSSLPISVHQAQAWHTKHSHGNTNQGQHRRQVDDSMSSCVVAAGVEEGLQVLPQHV